MSTGHNGATRHAEKHADQGSESERANVYEAAGLEAPEAERELLGMLLDDGSTPVGHQVGYLEEATALGLRPHDFRQHMPRCIFEQMLTLANEGLQPDLLMLYERMRGHVEGFGVADLQGMIPESGVPNLPRLRELVRVVRDASRRWRMVATGTKLAALAGARDQNSSASIEQVMASLQRLRDEESGPVSATTLADVVSAYRAEIDAWRADPFALRGTTTGLHILDRYTRGMHRGDLWIIGARMSMGKTAACLSMLLAAARACKPDHQVGIVSLEMSKKWLMHRLAAQVAGVDATAVEDGDPSLPWERIDAALDEIEQLPLRIVDAEDAVSRVNGSHGHMTPEVIRHLVQGWHQQATLDLVAVDYLEMVSVPEGMEHDLHTEQLGAIALAFRNLASELKIPVLVLAQLNRDSTKSASKVPTLEGIHNSDKPAMHADVVLFPVRWDYYRDRGQELPEDVASLPRGVTDILIAKQRNGGVGMARAYFDTASQRFLDWNEQRKCAVDYHGNIVAIEVAMSHQGQKA